MNTHSQTKYGDLCCIFTKNYLVVNQIKIPLDIETIVQVFIDENIFIRTEFNIYVAIPTKIELLSRISLIENICTQERLEKVLQLSKIPIELLKTQSHFTF